MNHHRPALAALCLTVLMPSLDTSIAHASLPVLAHAFGASFAQVQWVVLALACGVAFIAVEACTAAPLLRLAMFRDAGLCAGLAATALVAAVIASTLVVGPFYLARALALPAGIVGVVLSCGPMVSALVGVPAGRVVDRIGTSRMAVAGLAAMAAGALLLALLPSGLGVAGWLAGIVVTTAGYASFQAANNTALMHDADAAQRGLVSGLLSLARNLGLVTGVVALGAVFAAAASTADIVGADAATVAHGMHRTFAVDAALMCVALTIALAGAWLRRDGGVPERRGS